MVQSCSVGAITPDVAIGRGMAQEWSGQHQYYQPDCNGKCFIGAKLLHPARNSRYNFTSIRAGFGLQIKLIRLPRKMYPDVWCKPGQSNNFFSLTVIPCNGSILELDFFLSIEKKKHGIFKGLEKVL
jgi:hypothetical protein